MTDQTDGPYVAEVQPEQAASMAHEGALLLDVREPDEWTAGHIPGAVHIPLADLDPTALAPDVTVVAICRSGNRSSRAAASLTRAGRQVVNLVGGVQAWQERGFGLVTDDGRPGSVL